MAQSFGVTRMRLERIGDDRDRTNEKITDLLALAEEEQRSLSEYEQEQVTKYRSQIEDYENEINAKAVERAAAKITSVPLDERGDVARKLVRLHRKADLEVPATLRNSAMLR